MRKIILHNLITECIKDKKQIRQTLEENREFQRLVPMQVKEVFYDLYSASLEQSYKLLNHIAGCRSEIYNVDNEIYQDYQELDDIFIDFCFDISDFYEIKCNLL